MSSMLHGMTSAIVAGTFALGIALPQTVAAAVSLSCSAAGDNCMPLQNKLFADGSDSIDQGTRLASYAASANAASGSLAAYSSLSDVADQSSPGAFNLHTGANLFAQFTLLGPASPDPVPLLGLFSFHGTIGTIGCASFLQCEASVSYTAQFSGSDGNTGFQATFGAGRSTGSPDLNANFLVVSTTASGVMQTDASGNSALATLTAAVRPGYQFTLDLSLSAIARFNPSAPQGALAFADAGNTAMFNFILPEGYSLQATPGFLSTPLLFPEPVPVPAPLVLLASGMAVLGGITRRRRAA